MRKWISVVIMLLIALAVHAEVYTLQPDGSGDFPNIQLAISGCVNGDIIQLADGVYTGTGNRNINFMGRTITLKSVSGDAEACIIDVQGVHGNYINELGLLIDSGEGPATMIRDLTIQNSDGDDC